MRRQAILFLLLTLLPPLTAQPTPLTGAAELEQLLDRLNTLGSVLMLGAHPDDENTAVLAYFARGRNMETAYLSANRGEGGQNLIGTEQGELLGLVRTQELLAARRIDGAEQYFTRVIDFGYSKTPEEAFAKWGRELLLGDMVRVIRRFRPDVIISRFPPAPGEAGHGQHTAVGHAGPEAFEAAGDPGAFPEQLEQGLEPWQAKRYYWNTFAFTREQERAEAQREDRIVVDVGGYDPVLGKSYAAVAGESRSMHRSQAMGAPQPIGRIPARFAYVAGEPARHDLFDGVDVTWSRVPGGGSVGELLRQARTRYRPEEPEAVLPLLLQAHRELAKLEGHWPAVKRAELEQAIELASGLSLDAVASRWAWVPGQELRVDLTAVRRLDVAVRWAGSSVQGSALDDAASPASTPPELPLNEPIRQTVTLTMPAGAGYSQPPWLAKAPEEAVYRLDDPDLIGLPEAPPVLEAAFKLAFGDVEVVRRKPVRYRWVDRELGERERDLEVIPPVAVGFLDETAIFPSAAPRQVTVKLENNVTRAAGELHLEAPEGWGVTPASAAVELTRGGQEVVVPFELTPPAVPSAGLVRAVLALDSSEVSAGLEPIEYDHIPVQVIFPPAKLPVERVDVELLSNDIGYVMGAGDKVPQALEQLGARVRLLGPDDLASGDLARYDAIVTGVRALNTRPDLLAAHERLLDYVRQGGTLVVQYNTTSFRPAPGEQEPSLAPFPLTPSRERITDEDAPPQFLDPNHPLFQQPNQITAEDFEGWVQERGLYFMEEWDQRYDAPLAFQDPGEEPQRGGLLYARYGEGVYIFTGLAWFRQLPAGVPGAYRLFANLISAGKAHRDSR